jgi:predicted RND superfamily exporter protein
VICAVLPLMLTSVLCEALMVWLNIGVKVATLPVIALGVGIGVDYALYIMTVTLARLKGGMSLSEAYYKALTFTGKVVVLTGITLASPSPPGPGRRSSSRPTWASCWPSCSSGTCSAP